MPVNPPITSVRTSHSIAIKTAKGNTIGMIQSWNPVQNRDVTPVYELDPATSGDPRENVPGNVKGLDIRVARYDLYTNKMEQAFGTVELVFLSDQNAPITIVETWTFPDGSVEGWLYSGVYFKSIGKTSAADDNRIVKVDATLTYTRRDKLTF